VLIEKNDIAENGERLGGPLFKRSRIVDAFPGRCVQTSNFVDTTRSVAVAKRAAMFLIGTTSIYGRAPCARSFTAQPLSSLA
jgi:hypothetical protein